jgi:hypothetical protein
MKTKIHCDWLITTSYVTRIIGFNRIDECSCRCQLKLCESIYDSTFTFHGQLDHLVFKISSLTYENFFFEQFITAFYFILLIKCTRQDFKISKDADVVTQ